MRIPLEVVLPEKIRMNVFAEARDLRFDLRLRAVADAHHRDDRADADDDAERGKNGTQFVSAQRAERDLERRRDSHAWNFSASRLHALAQLRHFDLRAEVDCVTARSLATTPSRMTTLRCA